MKGRFLAALLALCGAASAGAQSLCVFDMAGANGPLYAEMQQFALAAQRWGVTLELRAYTSERIAADDFKVGQCDATVITGIRARDFNHFTGSIDSIGGLSDYDTLRQLVVTLARPELAGLMRSGPYETAGVLPLGAVYLFLRDRRIDSVEKMAGRRIAVLDYDAAQLRMAARIGAQPVSADVTNFAGKFNNGMVDVVAAPAVAYMPLELYKGVGSRGAVLRYPLAQATLQLLLRHASFPADFGNRARAYFPSRFDNLLAAIRQAEDEIYFFLPPPDGEADRYREMERQARIAMTAAGIYDPRMMSLLKRIRCRQQPGLGECSEKLE